MRYIVVRIRGRAVTVGRWTIGPINKCVPAVDLARAPRAWASANFHFYAEQGIFCVNLEDVPHSKYFVAKSLLIKFLSPRVQ